MSRHFPNRWTGSLLAPALSSIGLHLSTAEAPHIASYRMDVRLYPEVQEIRGEEVITWVNPTSDATDELWFHLYLNAFKNEESTFLSESGNGDVRTILIYSKSLLSGCLVSILL